MIFGFIEDTIRAGANIVEDAIDISVAVVTLGEYGELNKRNVSRLISSGMTLYAISEVTGVAVDLLEKALDE